MIEILKGLLALLGAHWLFNTLGEDWGVVLDSTLERFAPSLTLPDRAVSLLAGFDHDRQAIGAVGLLLYASLHLVEGYGLWQYRNWAEWLGTISGGIYIPFEIWELITHPSGLTGGILLLNTSIVAYLIYVIKTNPKREKPISRINYLYSSYNYLF